MGEIVKPIASVIGGVGSLIGLGSTGSTTIKTADPVNTDDALNQADDLLRRRQRKASTPTCCQAQVVTARYRQVLQARKRY